MCLNCCSHYEQIIMHTYYLVEVNKIALLKVAKFHYK